RSFERGSTCNRKAMFQDMLHSLKKGPCVRTRWMKKEPITFCSSVSRVGGWATWRVFYLVNLQYSISMHWRKANYFFSQKPHGICCWKRFQSLNDTSAF